MARTYVWPEAARRGASPGRAMAPEMYGSSSFQKNFVSALDSWQLDDPVQVWEPVHWLIVNKPDGQMPEIPLRPMTCHWRPGPTGRSRRSRPS
jgi:hypothetical protein